MDNWFSRNIYDTQPDPESAWMLGLSSQPPPRPSDPESEEFPVSFHQQSGGDYYSHHGNMPAHPSAYPPASSYHYPPHHHSGPFESYGAPASGSFYGHPPAYPAAQVPRSVRDSQGSTETESPVSQWHEQSYTSPPELTYGLRRHLEGLQIPITSFTFIGRHLGLSSAALPHYKELRPIILNIPDGPAHLRLLEQPRHRHSLTLVVTDSVNSPSNGNGTQPFEERSPYNEPMNQSVVHFDPGVGHVNRDGVYRSPQISLYHELDHSCSNEKVAEGQLTQHQLEASDPDFGNYGEKLAVQAENALGTYLGQGTRHDHKARGIARYKVANFSSVTPLNPKVVRAIKKYRAGEISWDTLYDKVESKLSES